MHNILYTQGTIYTKYYIHKVIYTQDTIYTKYYIHKVLYTQDSDSDSDSLFNINMYILCEKNKKKSDNYLVYTRICPGDRAKVM